MVSISLNTTSQMQTRVTLLRNHRSQIKRLFRLVGTCYKIPNDANSDFFWTTPQRFHLSHLCTYALGFWIFWFSKRKTTKKQLKTLPSTRKPRFSWFPKEATARATLRPQPPTRNPRVSMFPKEATAKNTFDKDIVFYKKTTYFMASDTNNKG